MKTMAPILESEKEHFPGERGQEIYGACHDDFTAHVQGEHVDPRNVKETYSPGVTIVALKANEASIPVAERQTKTVPAQGGSSALPPDHPMHPSQFLGDQGYSKAYWTVLGRSV